MQTEDSTGKPNRIMTLDVLKGILMIGIVMVHLVFLAGTDAPVDSITPSDTGEARPGLSSPIYIQMLYLGMMMFFISSGYFFRPKRSAKENIVRRVKQLIIPIVVGLIVLPTILYVYLTLLGQGPTWEDLYPSYKAVLGGVLVFQPYMGYDPSIIVGMCFVYNGYYFLQLMLVAFVLFYLLADKVLDDPKKLIISIVVLIACTALLVEFVNMRLPFYAQLSPLAAAFMLFGAAIGKKGLLEWLEASSLKNPKLWVFFIVSLALGALMVFVLPTGTGFDAMVFGDYGGWSAYSYFLAAVFTNMALLFLGSLFARIPLLNKALATAGRHSIAIICLHIFVIKLMMAPFHELMSTYTFPVTPIGESVVYWLVAVIVIVLVAEYVPKLIQKRKESKE